MQISITPNIELRDSILDAIEKNDGHCCCQIEKTERTLCICANFIEGPDGWCHCGLYYKESIKT